MTYQLIRPAHGWPRKDYTLADIQNRCRRLGLTIRDGYGRSRVRSARKITLSNGIQFRGIEAEEKPATPFGPRTAPAPS